MTAVVLGATIGGVSSMMIHYKPLNEGAETVLTVNGDAVAADEYSGYMLYNMQYYASMYAQMGLTDLWSNEDMAKSLGASMPEAAEQQAIYARVVMQKFNELGLKLSYNEQKEMASVRRNSIANTGKDAYLNQIAQFGFSDQTYQNFMYISQCYQALNDYYFGENGVNTPSDEDIQKYYEDNYITAKHILITTVDPASGETKRTDEEAKKEAQSILDRINAGEDFDTLMNQYSEDTGLSNNPKNPAKWVFPDISIEPGEYLLLYATDSADKAQKKNLKLNFNISSTGEALFFFDPNGKLIDKLSAGRMKSGQSYGRDGSDNRFYYAEPTPGAQNGKGYEGITQLPAFSVTPGIYDNAVTVAITAGEGETIRYTTDCTTPNASSEVYSGELSISKNSVIRAAAFRDGYLSGDVATATYLFRSDGVNHALPVVTLVTDPDNLWNSKTGIYATGDKFDPDAASYADTLKSATYYQAKFATEEQVDAIWEKPAAFSLFDDNGKQVFTQNVGIRIAGSFGRGRAQKGFNVIARKEYGKGSMEYPFFENRPYTEYKAVVLRAGAQDQNRSKIRDELASGLLEGTDINILYQAYRPTVLYLNGEYWGVYFMKEKRNRFFVAQHENTENNVDLAIGKGFKQRTYGDNSDWVSLYEYATSHDLSSSDAYNYVAERMDVDSFRDYMIAEIYNGNTDTYNFQYYRLKGGKWKFIFYDFCWGFQSPGHETLAFRMGKTPSDVCSAKLFAAMLQNKGWRDSFCRRFAELLNTAFAPERVSALIEELYGYVEPEIKREREKFNKDTFMGVKQPNTNLGTYEGFQSEISKLKDFAQKRPEELKRQLQSNLGLSDSYMKEVFG